MDLDNACLVDHVLTKELSILHLTDLRKVQKLIGTSEVKNEFPKNMGNAFFFSHYF